MFSAPETYALISMKMKGVTIAINNALIRYKRFNTNRITNFLVYN